MKINKKLIWIIALVLLICVGLVACDNSNDPTPDEEPKEISIQLNTSALDLDVYETATLVATVTNSEDAVVWSSSNDAVATVSGGVVTAIAEGEVTIKAVVGGKEATCVVTVTNSHIAPVLKPERNDVSVDKDGEYKLTVVTNWKSNPLDNVTYSWTLVEGEADDVASVTPTDGGAIIKGLKYGSTAYTLSTTVHGVTLAQKITINVCNTDITFEAGNLENEDGEYKARVSLVDTDNDHKELSPSLKVLEKNEPIEVVLEWVSSDSNIVSIENGKFVAKSEGKAILSTSYANNKFSVEIEAYRPEIVLEDSVSIEVGRLADIKIQSTIQGTISSVNIGESNVLSEVKDDGSISLKKEALPNDASVLGKTQIVIGTDLAFYKVNAEIYTMIIRNFDDLKAYASDITAQFEKTWSANGYYVLANDIDCAGQELNINTNWGAYEKALANLGKSDDGLWLSGKVWGFSGVFDGQGHNIDNFIFNSPIGGFVGTVIGESGVVRNVAFTNVIHKGQTGFIALGGNGTISNIYMSFKSVAPGFALNASNIQYTTAFISQDCMAALRINNCFVEYQEGAFGEDVSNILAIGSSHLGFDILNGVYAVGVLESVPAINVLTNEGSGDVYGAYATYADLLANVDLSSFENDFWTLVNGIPYPTALVEAGKTPVASVPDVTLERDIYGQGAEIELTLGLFDKIVLSDSAKELGCIVDGSKIKLGASLENGTKIEFSVVSVLDETKKVDLSITIDNREAVTVNVPDRQDVELNGDEDHSKTVIDIELVGTVESVSVKIAGTAIPNASVVDGELVINAADVPASLWGEKDLEAYIVTDSHFYTVKVPVTVITKVIRNREDLRWYSVHIKEEATNNGYLYGGYYVLGADIQFGDYDEADPTSFFHNDMNWNTYFTAIGNDNEWINGRIVGFNGVFDGRGYAIDNMIMDVAINGLVGTVLNANGVVRNLSLTNVTLWGCGGGIAYAGCGTIENVYMTVKAIANGSGNDWSSPFLSNDSMGEYKVKNSIVIYGDGAFYTGTDHATALGHLHPACGGFNNVYAIGAPSDVATVKRCPESCCGSTDTCIYGSYADADAFKDAVTVSAENGWDMSYWTVDTNGVAIPVSLVKNAE